MVINVEFKKFPYYFEYFLYIKGILNIENKTKEVYYDNKSWNKWFWKNRKVSIS